MKAAFGFYVARDREAGAGVFLWQQAASLVPDQGGVAVWSMPQSFLQPARHGACS
jgi:hypothetical protein